MSPFLFRSWRRLTVSLIRSLLPPRLETWTSTSTHIAVLKEFSQWRWWPSQTAVISLTPLIGQIDWQVLDSSSFQDSLGDVRSIAFFFFFDPTLHHLAHPVNCASSPFWIDCILLYFTNHIFGRDWTWTRLRSLFFYVKVWNRILGMMLIISWVCLPSGFLDTHSLCSSHLEVQYRFLFIILWKTYTICFQTWDESQSQPLAKETTQALLKDYT